MDLFFVPFAGGNKYSFKALEHHLPADMKITVLEPPGRGARIAEPLLYSLQEIADDMYGHMRPGIEKDYTIYGHSMGGIIAYLLALRARKEGHRLPVHLFVSGTTGPSFREESALHHKLEKDDFIRELINLGGLPQELLSNMELFDFFEPVLRADLQAIDTYCHTPVPPLDIPVTVLLGDNEEVTPDGAGYWQRETNFPIDLITFPGNHFFLFDHPGQVAALVSEKLGHLARPL